VSSVLAIFGTLYTICFPLFLIYLIVTKDLDSQEFKGKYGAIFAAYKTESCLKKSFPVVLVMRKVLFSVFLVYYSSEPGL